MDYGDETNTTAFTTYLTALGPQLAMLVTLAAFTAMLVPLFVILLLVVRPGQRCKPVYLLNVVAILAGLATGLLSVTILALSLVNPSRRETGPMLLADIILAASIPIYVDAILLLRVVTVYESDSLSRRLKVVVYGIPTLLIVTRVVNIVTTIVHIAPWFLEDSSLTEAESQLWRLTGTRIEYFLQVFNNACMSTLFLYKIRASLALTGSVGQSSSYTAKIRMLFWTASSNFLFPVMLSVTQLIVIYVKPNLLTGSYMSVFFVCNDIIQIIFALLATAWAATYELYAAGGIPTYRCFVAENATSTFYAESMVSPSAQHSVIHPMDDPEALIIDIRPLMSAKLLGPRLSFVLSSDVPSPYQSFPSCADSRLNQT